MRSGSVCDAEAAGTTGGGRAAAAAAAAANIDDAGLGIVSEVGGAIEAFPELSRTASRDACGKTA